MRRIGNYFLCIILILNMTFSVTFATDISYPIDIKGHWAEEEIKEKYDEHFIVGKYDNVFAPNDILSMEEMISLINRLFGLTNILQTDDIDISEEYSKESNITKYYNYINIADFKDKSSVFRIDMLTALDSLLEVPATDIKAPFKDINTLTESEKDLVNRFYAAGYINGYENGNSMVHKTLTRAEAIKFFDNSLGYIVLSQEDADKIPFGSRVTVIGQGITIEEKNIKDLYISPGVKTDITLKNNELNTLTIAGEKVVVNIENVEAKVVRCNRRSKSSNISILGNSQIQSMSINADNNVFIDNGASISNLEVNSKAYIKGQGSIINAKINADKVTLENKPKNYEIAKGNTAKIGGKEITNSNDKSKPSEDSSPSISIGGENKTVLPTSIDITGDNTARIGEQINLSVNILPSNTTNKKVKWESSNSKIAEVNNDGLVKCICEGEVTITVSSIADVNIKDTIIIKVIKNSNLGGELVGTDTISVGELTAFKFRYNGKVIDSEDINWSIGNDDIITFNHPGSILGVMQGSTYIMAELKQDSNIKASKSIEVIKQTSEIMPISLKITGKKYVDIGETTMLNSEFIPLNTTNKEVNYRSNDENIIKVDNDGVVTGVKDGKGIITAISVADKTVVASMEIEVKQNIVEVSEIEIDSPPTIIEGANYTLLAKVYPINATDKNVTWVSENEEIVSIDRDSGIMTAHNVGTTDIIATSNYDSSISKRQSIRVVQNIIKPTSVNIQGDNQILVNERNMISASVMPEKATNRNVRWKSSEPNILAVDDSGYMRGIRAGTSVVTATAVDDDRIYSSLNVTVKEIEPTFIKINNNANKIDKGDMIELTVSTDDNATNKDYRLESSNENVIEIIDKNIIAKDVGTALITAISDANNSIVDSVNIDVEVLPEKINIYGESKVSVGNNILLTAEIVSDDDEHVTDNTITWSSSDENILSVDDDGRVTGINAGSAEVIARANANENTLKKYSITVYPLPTGISINADNNSMSYPNDSIELTSTIYPENAIQSVTYSSSDEDIAQVDENGIVKATGTKDGNVTITITSTEVDTVNDNVDIEVSVKPTSIILTNKDIEIEQGEKIAINAKVNDSASNKELTFESSDESIVTIDDSGVMTGESTTGNAIIYITASGDTNVKAEVHVVAVPSSDSSLINIMIDGNQLENFSEDIFNYTVVVDSGATISPSVTATPKNSNATVTINKGSEAFDETEIEVVSQDTSSVSKYKINYKKEVPTDVEKIQSIMDSLAPFGYDENNKIIDNITITDNIELPEDIDNEVSVHWSLGDSVYLDTSGKIKRPNYYEGDKKITLTANVTCNEENDHRDYTIIIQKKDPYVMPGNGTESSPYQIKKVEDLQVIGKSIEDAKQLNYDKVYEMDKYYKLANNISYIDESDYRDINNLGSISSIGTNDNPFKGVFDGNNNKIISESAYGTPKIRYYSTSSLFDVVKEAEIKNVTFNLRGSKSIVCRKAIKSIFTNINARINPRHYSGWSGFSNSSYGGMIDWADECKIYDCDVDLRGSNRISGGIVGKCYNTTIDKCHVKNFDVYAGWAGGIVGNAENSTISNCEAVNVGSANDRSNKSIGGIVGKSSGTNIDECKYFARSKYDIIYGNLAGGISGESRGGSISNCQVNLYKISGKSAAGGIVGKSDYTDIRSCEVTTCDLNNEQNVVSIYSDDLAGGIIGYDVGKNMEISQCTVNLTPVDTIGYVGIKGNRVGGIVGQSNNITIEDCGIAIKNIKGKYRAGGLIGNITNPGYIFESCGKVYHPGGYYEDQLIALICKRSFFKGNVYAEYAAGGLIGQIYDNYDANRKDDSFMNGCYAIGEVNSDRNNGYSGGLIGIGHRIEIKESYAKGTVTGNVAGGLVGKAESCLIHECYSSNDVVGTSMVGGIVGEGYFDHELYFPSFKLKKLTYIYNNVAMNSVVTSKSLQGGRILGKYFINLDGYDDHCHICYGLSDKTMKKREEDAVVYSIERNYCYRDMIINGKKISDDDDHEDNKNGEGIMSRTFNNLSFLNENPSSRWLKYDWDFKLTKDQVHWKIKKDVPILYYSTDGKNEIKIGEQSGEIWESNIN